MDLKKIMSKYYYDTEFLEGTQTKYILGIPFGKTKPTIDLISIGIVSEDNRELYLISKDFNLKEAWNRYDLKQNQGCGDANNLPPRKVFWIRENVLKPIFIELWQNEKGAKLTNADFNSGIFNYKHLKSLINKYGKTNEQIAFEVLNFVHGYSDMGNWLGSSDDYYNTMCKSNPKEPIQLYGYYSAYDHVALCWLFGKMIDLPTGFPMYTRDLKQELDRIQEFHINRYNAGSLSNFLGYPKETNSHNALSDAKWNKALYEFLNNL